MKSKLETARKFSAHEWWLLARAWVWLLVIDLGLRLLPYKALQNSIEWKGPATTSNPADEDAVIQSMTRMVDRARRLHIYRMTCLRRSLALQRMLAGEGILTTLRFGVRKAEAPPAESMPLGAPPSLSGRLQAHAWLERNGRPISEPEALLGRYAVLAREVRNGG